MSGFFFSAYSRVLETESTFESEKGLGLVSPYLGRQATGFGYEVNMGLECVYFISLRGQGQVL